MKIKISLKVGNREYIEDVTEICQNSYSHKEYFREISLQAYDLKIIQLGKSYHFIFDWFDMFVQSDNLAEWLYEAEVINIKVYHE